MNGVQRHATTENKSRWILLFLILIAATFLSNAGESVYVKMYGHRAELIKKAIAAENAQTVSSKNRINDNNMVNQAYLCYVYGKASGNQEYVDLGLEMYGKFLAMNPNLGRRSDFHTYRPFALFVCRLNQDGLLTGDYRIQTEKHAQIFLKMFSANYKEASVYQQDMWDHNINMATYVTADALAIVFPDIEGAKNARNIAEKVIDKILSIGDLDENASNYATLGAAYFLDLLELENRTNEIGQSEKFRNFFNRWRDFVSPGLYYAEIGDSYFYHNSLPLDLILLMEMAANQYHDASFSNEAHRIMQVYEKYGQSSDDIYYRALKLMEIDNTTVPFTANSDKKYSAVYFRTLDGQQKPETFDKLILRTGDKPGDAMILMDLYCRGSHAHEFRRPAISYYEAGGIPLYHNLGRRGTTAGNNGNVFWVDEPTAFPGHPKPGIWNTMEVPVSRLASNNGEYSFGRKPLDFRTFSQRTLKSITFDNLRLEGNAGVKRMDGFESADLWSENLKNHQPPVKIETVSDCTEGTTAQRVEWSLFDAEVISRLLPPEWIDAKIDPKEYDVIKFDYKYDGPLPYFHLRGWCASQLDIGSRMLECEVVRAETQQYGSDAWGLIEYKDYMAPGNKLIRRLVLTKEGVLIIADTFIPGKHSVGKAIGQLWQLYSLSEKGKDYYVAGSDGDFPQIDNIKRPERRMMIKYAKNTGIESDVEEFTPGYMTAYKLLAGEKKELYKSFFTTCSKQQSVDKPVTMVQIIFPLLPDDKADTMASKTQIEIGQKGIIHLEFPLPGGHQTVKANITDKRMSIKR